MNSIRDAQKKSKQRDVPTEEQLGNLVDLAYMVRASAQDKGGGMAQTGGAYDRFSSPGPVVRATPRSTLTSWRGGL